MMYLGFISLIIAWGFNALMDKSSENEFKRSWFNKSVSWIYKYKTPLQSYQRKWYYSIYYPILKNWKFVLQRREFYKLKNWKFTLKSREFYQPDLEEKFPFSTNWFVAFSDWWHFFKFGFGFFLSLSSFFFTGLWWIPLVVKLCQWFGFNLIYNKKKL